MGITKAAAVSTVLADPSFPTANESVDIDYVKKNGTWEMKDKGAVETTINEAGKTASNL